MTNVTIITGVATAKRKVVYIMRKNLDYNSALKNLEGKNSREVNKFR
jgi:hypothetical protein